MAAQFVLRRFSSESETTTSRITIIIIIIVNEKLYDASFSFLIILSIYL